MSECIFRQRHHVNEERPQTASLVRPFRPAAATLSPNETTSQLPVGAERLRLVAAAAIACCAELPPDVEAPVSATARCAAASVEEVSSVRLTSIGRWGLICGMLVLFGKVVCFAGVDEFKDDV